MKTALISVNHLKITGVTTHVIQLCKFLLKNNIDVTVHVSQPTLDLKEFHTVYELLHTLKVKVINSTFDDFYDILYLNTSTINFDYTTVKCDRTIYFVHGETDNYTSIPKQRIYKNLEVVTFSETMFDYIAEYCYIPPRLIRHVVEHTQELPAKTLINHKLENILLVDAHFYQPLASKILEVCNKHGLSLRVCGNDSLSGNKFNIQEQILKSDLVIGQGGRTLYEAMSLGRNIISYGINPGYGYINTDNIEECIKTNCSYGNLLSCTDRGSATQLEQEILKYNYMDGYTNRRYAIENFSELNFKSLI